MSSRSLTRLSAAALALALLPVPALHAQRAARSGAAPRYDESLLRAMQFRLVGPFRGGRSTAVAGVRGQQRTFYTGTTGGGVWKTVDGGATWRNVSDKQREDRPQAPPTVMGEVTPETAIGEFFPGVRTPDVQQAETRTRAGDAFGTASVGAIAVAPSDPNVVYVGMGSACIRGNTSPGDGVYKTTDAGETWHHVGLPRAGRSGKSVVHPEPAGIASAAGLRRAFGAKPGRVGAPSAGGGRRRAHGPARM